MSFEECKYEYLLSISPNNFIVDIKEVSCSRLNRKGRRSDTFIHLYCTDCKRKCEGKVLKFE